MAPTAFNQPIRTLVLCVRDYFDLHDKAAVGWGWCVEAACFNY